ncbi:tetratricopeptide repeat protein [Thalassotalea sp. ND16A]|uniref:tetratricopeptide repeat protein n=1 Tax=Thalassotalea sp. ND16A TaxID=1535422 RepID=UPI00051A4108|nr:tetratricopeptide repeat protein [Thalassotalea sp. ND16A]KGK00500.1 hypothetical protein ND16A_3468 [Thalassotalea sp. ND16A]
MKEFQSSEMVAKIKLHGSNSSAQYYLQYKHYEKAIEIYQKMANANPDNARIQHELGDIYLQLNQKKYHQNVLSKGR